MCARCPFRPDGTGYAQDHPDLPKIIATVEAGLPFYCHETALQDPRTIIDADGNPAGYQEHYEICRGGHERRMKVWREKVIAAGHEPGELVLAKPSAKAAAFSPCPSRAVACPACNAAIGEFCRRKDGKDYRKGGKLASHVERVRAWRPT
jgi:hypothetical protein